MPTKPTPHQLSQLSEVLLNAFDHAALIRLTRERLDLELEWITPVAGKRDLKTIVSDLVTYFASQEGGLKRLVAASLATNPNNADLNALSDAWTGHDFAPVELPKYHPSIGSISTEGGASIQGDVQAGSDFVGRDKITGGDEVRGDKIIHIYHGIPSETRSDEAKEPEPGDPPYKGLSYFDCDDADLFFGREALTAKLIQHICDHSFLAVIGASGSGKSSLVRAGVIPVLQRRRDLPDEIVRPPGSEEWSIHVITPTARPLERLAASLTKNSPSVMATTTLMDDMRKDERSLHLHVQRMMDGASSRQRALLVVDQFEELFTLCRDQGERQSYVENLLYAAGVGPDGLLDEYHGRPCIIILTLRADFYSNCVVFRGLRNALEQYQKIIGPMETEELRRAIIAPLEAGNWQHEPGLVDQMMRDASDEPGRLPLLSHALLETWKRRRGRQLTIAGYIESGRVQGAIAKTAERVFTEQLKEEEWQIARNIFLRLTELGEGNQDTRRRLPRNEVIAQSGELSPVEKVVQILADARLITTDDQEIEVAHEALIREWPRLRDWLEEDREGLRIHRRLTEVAQEWDSLDRNSDLLYRRVQLDQAEEWAAQHEEDLNTLEADFLKTSRAHLDAEALALEEQRQLELQRVNELAEVQRQRAEIEEQSRINLQKLTRWLAGAVVVALVAAAAAGVFGYRSSQEAAEADRQRTTADAAANERAIEVAKRSTAEAVARASAKEAVDAKATAEIEAFNARRALSGQLALRSDSDRELYPQRSLLAAVEAIRVTQNQNELPVAAAETALRNSLRAVQGQALTPFEGNVCTLAVSPNGTRLVLADCEDGLTTQMWDLSATQPISRALFAQNGETFPVRREADMAAQTIQEEITLPVFHGMGRFSADGRWFLMPDYREPGQATGGTSFFLWDTDTLETGPFVLTSPAEFFADPSNNFLSATFSGNGGYLIVGGMDGQLVTWKLDVPEKTGEVTQLEGIEGEVLALQMSSGDNWLAFVAEDMKRIRGQSIARSVYLLPIDDLMRHQTENPIRLVGNRPYPAAGSVPPPPHFAFSPASGVLFTATDEGKLQSWSLDDDEPADKMIWQTDSPLNQIQINGAGRWLFAATANGERSEAGLWRLDDREPQYVPLPQPLGPVSAARFHPRRDLLAYSDENQTYIVDLADKDAEPSPQPVIDPAEILLFSQDGGKLIGGGRGHFVVIWDQIEPGRFDRIHLLAGQEGSNQFLASDPSGRYIVGITDGSLLDGGMGMTRLWDLTTVHDHDHHLALGSSRAVAVGTNERWLVAVQKNQLIAWDLLSDTAFPTRQILLESVNMDGQLALAIGPQGDLVAIGDSSGQIRLWPLDESRMVITGRDVKLRAPFPVSQLRFDSESNRLFAASIEYLDDRSEDTVAVWQLPDGPEPTYSLMGVSGRTLAMEVSPGGRWLAALISGETLNLWQLPPDQTNPTESFAPIELSAEDFAFSPDGQKLAIGGDRSIRIYELGNAIEGTSEDAELASTVLVESKRGSPPVAFSADGAHLFAVPDRLNVARWRVDGDAATQLSDLAGENASFRWLYAGKHSNWIVAANLDGPYRLWQHSEGEASPVARHIEIGGLGRPLVVSPDGRWLVTLGQDPIYAVHHGTLYLWRLHIDELLALACKKVGRNFSNFEWRFLFGQETYRKTCSI